MSDYSQQAGDNLFNAVANLGLTIAGKLDNAEAASQYNTGQEMLRRNMNQFALDLQSDPDWQKYPEKLAKAENDWWAQIDQNITHQGAKNALQGWWMDQRDNLEGKVGAAQVAVRSNIVLGQATTSTNGILQDVAAGADPAEAKAKLREIWTPLENSLLVDHSKMADQFAAWDHTIDTRAVNTGAFNAGKLPDGTMDFDKSLAFLADPKNTGGLTTDEVVQADARVREAANIQESQFQTQNGKLNLSMSDAYIARVTAKGDPTTWITLDLVNSRPWIGKQAGDEQQRWVSAVMELDARQTAGGAGGSPEDKQIRDGNIALAAADYRAGNLTRDQFNRLNRLYLTGGGEPGTFTSYDKEFTSDSPKDPSYTDSFNLLSDGAKKGPDGKVLYSNDTAAVLAAKLQKYVDANPDHPEKWIQYATNLRDEQMGTLVKSKINMLTTAQGKQIGSIKNGADLVKATQDGRLMGVWKDDPALSQQVYALRDLSLRAIAKMSGTSEASIRVNLDANGRATFGVPTGRASPDFKTYRVSTDGTELWIESYAAGAWTRVKGTGTLERALPQGHGFAPGELASDLARLLQ